MRSDVFESLLLVDAVSVNDHARMQVFKGCSANDVRVMMAIQFVFGVGSKTTVSGHPIETAEGLIGLAARSGCRPIRWHIEYFMDRWFLHIDESKAAQYEPPYEPPFYLCECRIVVDAWEMKAGSDDI